MRTLLAIAAFCSTLLASAVPNHLPPCADDSAAIAGQLAELRARLIEQAERLASTSGFYQRQAIARSIAEAADSWTEQVRTTWPDDDDGLLAYSMNTALAGAYAATSPYLSAVYQAQATAALLTNTSPYRPEAYAAVQRISELAHALARAENPKRVERLKVKLRNTCAELFPAGPLP